MIKMDSLGDPSPAGDLDAENFHFAVKELAGLFDRTLDEHGWPKGIFGMTTGVGVGSVADYQADRDLVYLAIHPSYSLDDSPNLGQAFVTMSPAAALALAALLRLAAQKARRS